MRWIKPCPLDEVVRQVGGERAGLRHSDGLAFEVGH